MNRFRSTLRALFFWSHLGIGLSAGLLILLMSVTGVLLGFERQMIAWIDGAPRVARSAAEALPLAVLAQRASPSPDEIASLVVRRDPTQPVTIRLRDRNAPALQLDPYRGEIVKASGQGKGQEFFSALRRWHRWVGAQGTELRAQMKLVAGTANLLFLGLVLSGLYLWWPRRWSVARLRAIALPQWHRAGKVRDFNWHNSLGFWFALPLALIIASGVFISFRWPGQWLDVALGSAQEREAAREAMREASVAAGASTAIVPVKTTAAGSSSATVAGAGRSESFGGTEMSDRTGASLDVLVGTARATRPQWAQLTITIPEAQDSPVRVVVAEGNTYRPDQRWTLEFDGTTGALMKSSGYADLSPARKIRAWVRFGHTGEVFGIPGQLLATLASAVGVLLVWTGFTLAWRRLVQWQRGRRRSLPAVTALPDPAL